METENAAAAAAAAFTASSQLKEAVLGREPSFSLWLQSFSQGPVLPPTGRAVPALLSGGLCRREDPGPGPPRGLGLCLGESSALRLPSPWLAVGGGEESVISGLLQWPAVCRMLRRGFSGIVPGKACLPQRLSSSG